MKSGTSSFSSPKHIAQQLSLTPDQQRQLTELRRSVTASDMLHLSDHFRLLAQRIRNQDMISSRTKNR